MKRRWLSILFGLIVAGVAIGLVVTKIHSAGDERAFQEQIRLARAEGLPTNWQEYAATIKPAPSAENAAPLYRQLKGKTRTKDDPTKIDDNLLFHRNDKALASAETFLKQNQAVLEIAEKASRLPRCWFDRDWSEGFAVLMPEFADMKFGAKLLALRGSICADRGDAKGALENVKQMLAVAGHAGEEGHVISRLVREAIMTMAVQHLAYWSLVHRDQPAYANAIRQGIDGLAKPNLKEEHRDELYAILSLVDLSVTPEGRKKLGIREEDVGAGEKIFPVFLSRPKAKLKIVKAIRAYWAALDRPSSEQAPLFQSARTELGSGLLAFPTAFTCYESLAGGDDATALRLPTWVSRRLQYTALQRALSSRVVPRSIKTSDLPSPFDGKPLEYSFNGKQIVITASGGSGDNGPAPLKVPPDRVFKK